MELYTLHLNATDADSIVEAAASDDPSHAHKVVRRLAELLARGWPVEMVDPHTVDYYDNLPTHDDAGGGYCTCCQYGCDDAPIPTTGCYAFHPGSRTHVKWCYQ